MKNWDASVPRFPVALVSQVGANRATRRAGRPRDQVKSHFTPPGSMVPHVRRLNQETGKVEYVPAR